MAVRKRNLVIPMLPLLFLTFWGIVAANAKFKYIHPMYSNVKFSLEGDAGPKLVLERTKGVARAVISDHLYDFGVMNPLTQGRHTFTIRNEGDATLRLSDKGTSCKCTVADIRTPIIEPGDETTIEVVFNTGRDRTYFQTVLLGANDPTRRNIRLEIRGTVRVQIAAEPHSVDLGTVDPTQAFTPQNILIYSRTLKNLQVLKGKPSIEHVRWNVGRASEDDIQEKEALGAVWVTMEPPPIEKLADGPFTAVLELEIEGVNDDEELVRETVRVGIGGKVARRFAVYGQTINELGVIDLGNIEKRQHRRARLLVKIRDPQKDLSKVEFKVVPDFVQASWTPKSEGLYTLDITIPATAPVGDYSGAFAGSLTVVTDHQRIEPQTFKLEFDIVDR